MPRTTLPKHIFFKKMKKKPALQAILDNFDFYTIDELQNVQGQPKWIRDQLVRLKKESDLPTEFNRENIVTTLAMNMDPDFTKANPTRKYENYDVRKWIGGMWFMPAGTTGDYKIEIGPGDFFLILKPGRVKIQSSISNMNVQHWNYFQQNSEYIGIMNISEFAKFVSDQLTQKHGNIEPMTTRNYNDLNYSNTGLFKIYKH